MSVNGAIRNASTLGALRKQRRRNGSTQRESSAIRVRQRIGKYRIEARLGQGGFATVYQAMDTIEGIRVAVKVPHAGLINDDVLRSFKSEVRITARLDHPNILQLKDASIIDDRFVLVFPLGDKTLGDRLRSRIATRTILDYGEQVLTALAYAHDQRIIHCDIKPANVLLFPEGVVRLTDFGIAKVAMQTLRGQGTGTVGHMAPEQAMGRPSIKSDVFATGLMLHRMFTGELPEWPFEWPFPGDAKLRRRVHPEMRSVLRKATEYKPSRRYRDAEEMLRAYRRARRKTEQRQ